MSVSGEGADNSACYGDPARGPEVGKQVGAGTGRWGGRPDVRADASSWAPGGLASVSGVRKVRAPEKGVLWGELCRAVCRALAGRGTGLSVLPGAGQTQGVSWWGTWPCGRGRGCPVSCEEGLGTEGIVLRTCIWWGKVHSFGHILQASKRTKAKNQGLNS